MSETTPIRDLIYFDFDKAASIASQLEGGLLREIHESQSDSDEIGLGMNLHFFNVGGKTADSRSKLAVRSLHHDLLARVVQSLRTQELSLDLTKEFASKTHDVETLHSELETRPYVQAEGVSRFHDFERIKTLVNGVNAVIDFAAESARDSIKKSEAYQIIARQVDEAEQELKAINNPKQKSAAKRDVKSAKAQLEQIVDVAVANAQSSQLPDWQVKGIDSFINLIVPRRKLLVLQPFNDNPDLKLICNLKEDCFVDSDLDNLLFAYGSQPNVRLSVFGLATHIPAKESLPSDDDPKNAGETSDDAVQQLERAFESVFDGIKPIENFGRFAYYPRVTVYPLAVYRIIRR